MEKYNSEAVKKCVKTWLKQNNESEEILSDNELHIDEIDTLKNIKRHDWIEASFSIFKIIVSQVEITKPIIPFLHIDLSYTDTQIELKTISVKWINNNLGEYTPPSYHFCTEEYCKSFYGKELIKCNVDDQFFIETKNSENISVYYRSYYDKDEKMFSRELYVFPKLI